MVETTLLIAAAVLLMLVAGVSATRRFIATGERPLLALAVAALAFAALVEVGISGDYFRTTQGHALAALSALVALGLAIQWYRGDRRNS